jgi:hypothetical protein
MSMNFPANQHQLQQTAIRDLYINNINTDMESLVRPSSRQQARSQGRHVGRLVVPQTGYD